MPGVRTLGEVLEHDGPLAEGPLREIAAGIADALARVHAIGLVHGRLGPDQVLITPYGPRVTGFAGRPADAGGDPAQDVYAFADLITLAGGGTSPASLRPLLRRCLDPDPDQRPTAADLDRVLTPRPPVLVLPPPVRDTADVPREVEAQEPPTGRGPTRRRLLVAGGVAVTAATVTAAGFAYARLANSGRAQPTLRWRRAMEGRVTTLQVFAETGYCACTDNVFKAFGTATGVPVWTARTDGILWSEPVVTAAAVYVACPPDQIYALDSALGQRTWQLTADAELTGSPVLSGTSLVVSTLTGELLGLDTVRGERRWTWKDRTEHGWAGVAAAGETLYVTYTDGTVFALRADSREVVWTVKLDPPLIGPPRAIGGLLYVVCGWLLLALDPRTGDTVWRYRGRHDLPTPVFAENLLYTTGIGALYALDPATGTERWRRQIGASVPGPIAVVGGVAYAGGDGVLNAFDAKSGEPRWTYPVPTDLTTAPAGTEDLLVFGTAGQELIALDV
jgi:outer membrane protein assembly factor BamB